MFRLRLLCLALVFLFLFSFAHPVAGEEAFTATIQLENRLAMIRSTFLIEGNLVLSRSADRVECEIFDLRQVAYNYSKTFTLDENEREIDMRRLFPASAFAGLPSGEKRLTVRVFSGDSCATDSIRFTVLGNPRPLKTITRQCTYNIDPQVLWNGLYHFEPSWHKTAKQDSLCVTFPADEVVSMVQIEWTIPPSDYTFEAFDANDRCLSSQSCPAGYNLYCETFHIDETARKVVLTLGDPDAAVAALHVFAQDGPTVDVQDWQAMPEKLDLMMVSTHQDDELLFFGGTIPYYSTRDCEMGLVYVVKCSRARYAEALSGLWIAGMRNHPVFLGYRDGVPESYEAALALWGGYDGLVADLVEEIRHYKPEVILTHGEDGDYRHKQHMVVSDAVLSAVLAASDPEKYPESYEKYGAWSVKKLYRHQSFGEGVMHMDWSTPLSAFDGRTPLEMSEIAYNRHDSQNQILNYSFYDRYDNTAFALVYSTVGPDLEGGDFLENIKP